MAAASGADLVDRYIAAWIADDRAGLSEILAGDVVLEANLGGSDDFRKVLRRLAARAKVQVAHRVDADDRCMVIYDCTGRDSGCAARVVEYVDVTDGRISRVRRVYDVVGFQQAVPALEETAGSA